MGIRPTAHVWYGTEAVESLLFSETDEDGEEQKHLDAYDTSAKLQEEFGVQIVELYW